ncbi:MAG: enoyl-CoA hydratase-related protein [Pseudotabrizicola sp.]|uniref:enoyl-CoA hydratase-related protein n=1 Tax=Pseudotabrizicola sp. TaxID=2939647 RepID=UPI0027214230|nr:enoyl-CoA hydratase-related protein [Pseudotabrizicola sp.]MDO9637320.1 enoyl-CoA hydratase-related protein [Pseudotabrizicola sp.]
MDGPLGQCVEVTALGGVAEVTLLRPPGGGWLDAAQRAELLSAITAAGTEPKAILLRAADRMFASHADAGPDLPDPDDAAQPSLASLCLAIETSPVPVVVFLEGLVSGAAAEIALAAQMRLATPAARLAFPAARLGRISGAGGTQRLPRLIGADYALRLLISGKPVAAPEALIIGLVDQVIEDAAPDDALARAKALALTPPARPQPEGSAFLAAVKKARAAAAPGSLAMALADCAEAALLLPDEQGYAFEAALAQERDALPQTAALAHLLRAERLASGAPEPLRDVTTDPVQRPALVGASPQLSALALMMLARGLPVTVLEPDREKLVPMLQTIASRQEAAVQAGTLSAAQRDADWARLRPVADVSGLEQADLVVIAAETPVPALRRQVPVLVMGRGDLPDGAFRLVLSGRVAELCLPVSCPAEPAAKAMAFLRRIGQTVVLTGPQSPMGIAGRLAGASGAALRALMTSGVLPEAIYAALTDFGMVSPALPKVAADAAPRAMPGDEIINRWLGALANEGVRVVASGLAMTASDVDLVAVHGLGLPADCGGPLHHAEQRGLMILRRDLRIWGAEADVWVPVPALDTLVSAGRGFQGSVRTG